MDNLPFITAALICEKVLQEKDGSLSVIRIVDRAEAKVYVQGNVQIEQAQQAGMNPTISLMMLVGVKSGSFKGKGVITIDSERPSGEKKPTVATQELDFQGGDQGQKESEGHNARKGSDRDVPAITRAALNSFGCQSQFDLRLIP